MKGLAIVSMLEKKNHGVLDSFVRNSPDTVVLTPSRGPANSRLAPRITASGLRLLRRGVTRHRNEASGEISLRDGLRFLYDRAFTNAESASWLSRLDAVLGGEEWLQFASDRGWSASEMGTIVAERARTDLPGIAAALASLERSRSSRSVRLVVVNEDFSPTPRAVVLWAREHGIPTLHLSHALTICQPYTVHGRIMSDVLAVFGQRGTEDYLDEDAEMFLPKIRTTGNPAWDIYPQIVPERDALRAELAARHGCSSSLPWVVFATAWDGNQTAFSDEAVFGRTLTSFLEACKTLIDAGDRLQIVIKDRPPNREFGRARLAEVATDVGVDQEHIVYALGDIEKWIVVADVVVSVSSNVSVEALLASTPAINLATAEYAAMYPMFDAESGIVEVEGHELAAALERILNDAGYREHLCSEMRRAAPRYNLGFDGTATERVVELMEELALPDA